jgi:hypothetical protein
MARMFTFAIALGLVLILSGTTTSADVTFTLEEQFQKLSDDFVSKCYITAIASRNPKNVNQNEKLVFFS